MTAEYPIAYVIDETPNQQFPGATIVQIACPLCGGRHQHGGRPSEGDPGARSAHCHGSVLGARRVAKALWLWQFW